MKVTFFQKTFETADQELICLSATLQDSLNKKAIQKRFKMQPQQVAKILSAKSLIVKTQDTAKKTSAPIMIGDNVIANKIIRGFFGEDAKGITVSYVHGSFVVAEVNIPTANVLGYAHPCSDPELIHEVSEQEPTITKAIEKSEPKKVSKMGGKRTPVVTPELIIAILIGHNSGVSIAKLAEGRKISTTTVHRIIKGEYAKKFPLAYDTATKTINGDDEQKVEVITDTVTEEEVQETTITEPEVQEEVTAEVAIATDDDLTRIEINATPTVHMCGLVKERHIMPVDHYVFEESAIDPSLMFDYKSIEDRCRKYIEDNIKFDSNGKPRKSIQLYVTGIQCVLAAFIKVCKEYNIDLTLMHHDLLTKTYQAQVIWASKNATEVTSTDCFSRIFVGYDEAYLYRVALEDIIKLDKFFVLTITQFKPDTALTPKHQEMWLCKDFAAATEAFNKALSSAVISTDKVGLYLDECVKKNAKYYKNKKVLQTKNF